MGKIAVLVWCNEFFYGKANYVWSEQWKFVNLIQNCRYYTDWQSLELS